MKRRLQKQISLVPPVPEGRARSGTFSKQTEQKGEAPVNASSSSNMRVARKVTGDDIAALAHPAAEIDPETRTHYKFCDRCKAKKPIEVFEGRKNCKDCRSRAYKNWQRVMRTYKANGIGQRIPLDDVHKAKIRDVFHSSCAFCGGSRGDKLRFTRLIAPRKGGGDEFFNIILSCVSCMQSRKGWDDWADWYKSDPEIYSSVRFQRIMKHHNEDPST